MKSTNTEIVANKVASILFDIGAVLFSRNKPFRFDSGILSPVYVDLRLLLSYPKERKYIINRLTELVKQIGLPDVIGGVAISGIPHAAWISENLNLPMIFIREKPKDHGRGNQVEGVLKRSQRVLIIEELVSTASSSIVAIDAVRKLGGKVTDQIAIYTHDLKKANQNFKKSKVKFHYLTSTMDVAKVAAKKGSLKSEQIDLIKEWVKDPQQWGKKMGFE